MDNAGVIQNRVTRLSLLLLLVAALGFAGCAAEPINRSARPWNSPEGWQNGALPGMVTQPR